MIVKKPEYNEFVQKVQSECIAWGMEYRTQWAGGTNRAYFQIYWDGRWREVASEVPFVGADNSGIIDSNEWLEISARAAHSLLSS